MTKTKTAKYSIQQHHCILMRASSAIVEGNQASTKGNQQQLEVKERVTIRKRWRLLALPAGRCQPIFRGFDYLLFIYKHLFSQIYSHILIGLPSESLLLAGGRRFDDGIYVPQTTIWLLQNDMWNQIGNLKNVIIKKYVLKITNNFKADWWESAIMINNSIFIVSGLEYPHTIERLDFQGDLLTHHEIIGNTDSSHIPVLFEVSADYCA